MSERRTVVQVISDRLRDGIEARQYAPGSTLPSESELCRLFEASRGSVRRALDVLETGGFINRQAGVGSFVCDAGALRGEKILDIGITSFARCSDWYTDDILQGANAACGELGARLVFADSREFMAGGGRGFDGFFTLFDSETMQMEKMDAIAASGIPVVLFNRFTDCPHLSYFSVDYELEARRAVEFLIGCGHRRIGLLDTESCSRYASETRSRGYFRAVEAAGLPSFSCEAPEELGSVGEIEAFITRNRLDALFITTRYQVDYALFACRNLPGEAAAPTLLCFDKIARHSSPEYRSIIYIEMPLRDMAYDAMRHVIGAARRRENASPLRRLYEARLILSTGNPPFRKLV